ncbi:hypothetical protein DDE82_001866 [Stemphylium lycopersici]|nr:hypothetical protein DDE82_001866 [Stemphylium lycopersici]
MEQPALWDREERLDSDSTVVFDMHAVPQKKRKLEETAGGFERLAKDLAASSVQLRDFMREHIKEVEALERELFDKDKIIGKLGKKNVQLENENARLENERINLTGYIDILEDEKFDLLTDNDQLRVKIFKIEEKRDKEEEKREQAEKKLKEYREAQRHIAAQLDSDKTSNKTCSKPFNYKNLLPISSSDNHSKTVMQGPHSITTAMQALNTSLVLGGGVSLPPSPDQPDQPVPSALMSYPSVLTLDVGGRIFKVSRKKLEAGSSHFRSLLSNTTAWEPQEDGTYFLDADADLFEHMLRFMRRPEVFPLFYDASKGFDYDLYNRLEVEATHFQVWELAKWIAEKKYLEAVEMTIYPWPNTLKLDELAQETLPGNASKDIHIIPRTRKKFICSCRIPVHMGAKEECDAACEEARGDGPIDYEEVSYVETVTVKKEVVFNEYVCRAA